MPKHDPPTWVQFFPPWLLQGFYAVLYTVFFGGDKSGWSEDSIFRHRGFFSWWVMHLLDGCDAIGPPTSRRCAVARGGGGRGISPMKYMAERAVTWPRRDLLSVCLLPF